MRDEPSPGNKKQNGKSYTNGDEELAQLRQLLVGPEQKEIQVLQQRIENVEIGPEEVSRVLPDAIQLREKDKRLIQSLQPSVEEAIRISVERNPKTLVDALFPVMGPAIRKAISATFAAMIQSLNQTLDYSLSARGLKWRWEAFRTGKPFAEIVLLHSLSFRVEQVLLIHKSSGLLLQHVIAPSIHAQDADMVSGMLTAIQDFIRDSFNVEDDVNSMQVGSLNVWIEQGPHAYLAAVIRGSAPQQLRTLLQETLERIHQRKSEELISFQGDSSSFESVRPQLEDCLQVQYKTVERRTSPFTIALFSAAILILGWQIFTTLQKNRYWHQYLDRLNSQPGIVVTEAEKRSGKYYVSGLRDPLAADPARILEDSNLDPTRVIASWNSYQAMEPQFILQRARKILAPPASVMLRLNQGVLSASGTATQKWMMDTRLLAKAIPGVIQYDDRMLNNADFQALESARNKIEQVVLRFLRDKSDLSPGQDSTIQDLARNIQNLLGTAGTMGIEVKITVIGRADSEGSEEHNLRLSSERADRIARLFQDSGLDPSLFELQGVGTKKPLRQESSEAQKEYNRSVSLEIQFTNRSDEAP